jgi:hypothetical protein
VGAVTCLLLRQVQLSSIVGDFRVIFSSAWLDMLADRVGYCTSSEQPMVIMQEWHDEWSGSVVNSVAQVD